MPITIYPNFPPWSDHQDNFSWINIIIQKIENQNTNVRTAPNAITTSLIKQYTFLTPHDINYNVDHHWDPYENITSRLANAISNYITPTQDIKAFLNNITSGNMNWSWIPTNTSVVNYRVDAPLVYKGSSPFTVVLTFDFLAYNMQSAKDINDVVLDFKTASSPKKQVGNFLQLDPPNIFALQTTKDTTILNIQYAALTSVVVGIAGPYLDGYPIHTNLQLTFQDITPLFDSTFKSGSSVTASVTQPGGISNNPFTIFSAINA